MDKVMPPDSKDPLLTLHVKGSDIFHVTVLSSEHRRFPHTRTLNIFEVSLRTYREDYTIMLFFNCNSPIR